MLEVSNSSVPNQPGYTGRTRGLWEELGRLSGGLSSPHLFLSITQVCLCTAANVAYSLGQNVLYIDSSGGLTASRLLQLLQARTEDEEEQVRVGKTSLPGNLRPAVCL